MVNGVEYLLFVGGLDVTRRYSGNDDYNHPYACDIAPWLDWPVSTSKVESMVGSLAFPGLLVRMEGAWLGAIQILTTVLRPLAAVTILYLPSETWYALDVGIHSERQNA